MSASEWTTTGARASLGHARVNSTAKRAFANATSERSSEIAVDRYNTNQGPMAGLLRILRANEGGEGLTTKALYERATAENVPTRSVRHMKGLLAKMKAIDRVRTIAPVGAEGKKKKGSFTYAITEVGTRHCEKLERMRRPPQPMSA